MASLIGSLRVHEANWSRGDFDLLKQGLGDLPKRSMILTRLLEVCLALVMLEFGGDCTDKRLLEINRKKRNSSSNNLISSVPPFRIITPTDRTKRGSMLTLKFNDGDLCKDLHKKIEEQGVVIDYRHPNALRVAPTAMYNSFQDVI